MLPPALLKFTEYAPSSKVPVIVFSAFGNSTLSPFTFDTVGVGTLTTEYLTVCGVLLDQDLAPRITMSLVVEPETDLKLHCV